MKTLILSVSFVLSTLFSFSRNIRAIINNGDWSTATTWTNSIIPTNGDTATIPAGLTVVVSNTINISTSKLVIQDSGILDFTGGNTVMYLASTSIVNIYPDGSIVNGTGNGSHLIYMGTNLVYKSSMGTINGPATLSSQGGFTTLPVTFIAFTLTSSSQSVLVQWSTAQEIGSSYYNVERSTDGSNWTTIATISSAGNSTSEKDYSYTDLQPQAAAYYRIKQVDMKGSFCYTAIKSVKTNAAANAMITIAPAGQGRIALQFNNSSTEKIQVRFISLNGQVAGEQQVQANFGQTILSTQLKGVYVVAVSNGKDIQVAKQLFL